MTDSKPLLLTLSPAWDVVVRGLDAAVAKDHLAVPAREVALRPVELLRRMADEAIGAMGDDVLAAERLRMLLYLAWPFASRVEEARKLEATPPSSTNRAPPVAPYEPGVIDHGALVIVALAAVRVAPRQMAGLFARTVHGLALAAAPAEVLGRLLPREPGADELAVVLETLYTFELVGASLASPLLRPFVADPVERGRWRCLEELLGNGDHASWLRDEIGAKDGTGTKLPWLWDGAWSEGIASVRPDRGVPGDKVVVRGRLPEFLTGGATLEVRIPATTQVIFGSPDGAPQVAKVDSAGVTDLDVSLTVVVPEGVQPGWVGFCDDEKIRASNAHRAEVKKALPALLDGTPCMVGTAVAAWAIPLLQIPDPARPGQLLSVPPRIGTNRFNGGAPALTVAELAPAVVQPGGDLVLTWSSANADSVRLEPSGEVLAPSGQKTLQAPASEGGFEIALVPIGRIGDHLVEGARRSLGAKVHTPARIADVTVTQGGRGAPFLSDQPLDVSVTVTPATAVVSGLLRLPANGGTSGTLQPTRQQPGKLEFQIPKEALHDGLTFVVEISEDPAQGPSDRRDAGPFSFQTSRALRVVLVLPSILEADPHPERDPPFIDLRALAVSPSPNGTLLRNGDGLAAADPPDPGPSAEPEIPALSLEEATSLLAEAARPLGLEPEVRTLPWLDDSLSTLVGPIHSAEEPHLTHLLERLSRRALLTPGFEDALWLMLVPSADSGGPIILLRKDADDPAPAGFHRLAPSSGAMAVAVADGPGLSDLLAALSQSGSVSTPSLAVPRLRLLGVLDQTLELEALAQDTRRAGQGAPTDSGVRAVLRDGAGRELGLVPLKCMAIAQPMQVEALVALAPEVCTVELYYREVLLQKLVRTLGTPDLERVALAADQSLTWNYSHSRGARAELMIALVRGDLVTPAIKIDARVEELVLPPRFQQADSLLLQASDGWNVVRQELKTPIQNPNPVVLRRLSDGRFWADVPSGWGVSWKLNGEPLGTGRSLWLKPGVSGTLELEAALPGHDPATDLRELLPGEPW